MAGNRKEQAEIVALRGSAAMLFGQGMGTAEVAKRLGISERRAARLKADVAEAIHARRGVIEDGLAAGAAKAAVILDECAPNAARTLGLIFAGKLPATESSRAPNDDADADSDAPMLYEQEPAMIAQRRMAAKDILTLVLGLKHTVSTNIPDDKLTRILALGHLFDAADDDED